MTRKKNNNQKSVIMANKNTETESPFQIEIETQTPNEMFNQSEGSQISEKSIQTLPDSAYKFQEKEKQNFSSDEKLNSDVCIPMFEAETGMDFCSWLGLFTNECKNCSEIQKLNIFRKHLKGTALTFYINNCTQIKDWDQLVETFKEKFFTISFNDFGEFTNLKFKETEEISDYFRKKIEMGRNLNLTTPLILQGLTDGLPTNLKQLVNVNPPNNPPEWLQLVTRLLKNQPVNSRSEPSGYNLPPRTFPNRPVGFPRYSSNTHGTPQSYYRGPTNFQPYRGNFNFPQRQERYFRPPVSSVRNVTPQPPRFVSHYANTTFPPYPCRICEAKNIRNAFHWHYECPFAINGTRSNDSEVVNANNSENVNNQQ